MLTVPFTPTRCSSAASHAKVVVPGPRPPTAVPDQARDDASRRRALSAAAGRPPKAASDKADAN